MTDLPWPDRIAEMAIVKSAIHEQTDQDWPYHLPRVKLSDAQLADLQDHLGVRLDARYAAFLAHGDGWRAFMQEIDLFGATELRTTRGADAIAALSDAGIDVLSAIGVAADSLLVIGSNPDDLDLWITTVQNGVQQPTVIWWAGQVVDTFATFEDFFAAMIDYNRHVLARDRSAG